MIILEALGAAVLVAMISLIGVFFFGNNKQLIGWQRYIVPMAVGVFLSLVLFELIPETIEMSPDYGGLAVAFGFITFYILASILHGKYHHLEEAECDRRGAAMLLLIGDGVHNFADGIVLGGAFLLSPAVGLATAVGLALHEIPQEIIEFGVLIRAGYSRTKAALLNLLSATTIIFGTLLIILIAHQADQYIWLLTGIAAGNLLFLAASDLLPRIHGNLKNYGSIWRSSFSIILGFIIMTGVLIVTHDKFGQIETNDHSNEMVQEVIDLGN